MENKLLTICIPTYNREQRLDYSLSCFKRELGNVDKSMLDIYISDNCSPDHTKDIVDKYIREGLPITYSRNDENIGPDNNFLKCFYYAKSKYLWLLGDDDYIIEGKLKVIVDILNTNDIGCLNIKSPNIKPKGIHTYNKNQEFLIDVGHWVTFMSGNIISTDSIKATPVTEWMRNSNLLQVPFFIDAILQKPINILLKDEVFEKCEDDSNGGYNFYKVFVNNYLHLWKSYLRSKKIRYKTYWRIKRRVMSYFVYPLTKKFYLQKKFPNIDKHNAWKILVRHYWYEPYFYFYITKYIYEYSTYRYKG